MLLHTTDRDHLGAVRVIPGLKAAEAGSHIWLRGIPAEEKWDLRLRSLPAVHTYELRGAGLLFEAGANTPVATLPDLAWQELPAFLPVESPTSALPGVVETLYPVLLKPAGQEAESSAMIVPLADLKQYAEHAPAVRLEHLRYAVAANGTALVLGTPLLPLPGKIYWQRGQLLIPAGHDFDPPIVGALVEAEASPLKDALVLFAENGQWERIEHAFIQSLSRSGVRHSGGGSHGN